MARLFPVVTLHDVARRAGVSVTTVSRLLNGDPNIRVREETRKRVLRTAKQMNYTTNHAGRALRLARTGAIALIVPDVNNAIFADLLRGVEEGADSRDYMVLLGRTEKMAPGGDQLRRLLGEGRVDGFLLQTLNEAEDPFLRQLADTDVPMVLVNSRSKRHRGSVVMDDVAGARVATEHLIGLGHQRIGLISGTPTTYTARQREEGFHEALRAAGLRRRDEWMFRLGYEPEAGATAMTELLQRRRPPTAVFVANVNAAIAALGAARDLGVDVPGELSIVAYHDVWVCDHTWPPLTTVKMPLYELGQRAVQALADRLADGTRADLLVDDPAPVLVERASTAPPA